MKNKVGENWRLKRKKTTTRKRTNARSKKKKNPIFRYEIIGLIFIAVGLIGIFHLGFIGEFIYALGEFVIGSLSYGLLVSFIILGGYLMIKRTKPKFFFKAFNWYLYDFYWTRYDATYDVYYSNIAC